MPVFNLNWFLGVLAIELWIAAYALVFWPDIQARWHARRAERAWRRALRAQPAAPFARASWYT